MDRTVECYGTRCPCKSNENQGLTMSTQETKGN